MQGPQVQVDRSRHAVVIGAGLAGAAVCSVLAGKGWRLTLLDAASGPAKAASALPVGMLSPHVTRAPTPLSRLSAIGVADTRAELERLVPQGRGWQACEVDNLSHDTGRWPAALVRPSALVQAWLDEAARPGCLTTHWNQPVAHLWRVQSDTVDKESATRAPARWRALAADGSTLAEAPVVVVCAAFGSLSLLTGAGVELPASALPLRPVKGQLSLAALSGEPLASRPQRDNGVYVPSYEDAGLTPQWPRRIWAMGSTYARGDASTNITSEGHERNAQSLQVMNPKAAERLREAADTRRLLGWAEVRCASLDRLPLVGAVPDNHTLLQLKGTRRRYMPSLADLPREPGLYVLSAMGSRGITLAHWCARLLGSQMQGESFDAEPDLIAAIDPARFAWRQARRSSTC